MSLFEQIGKKISDAGQGVAQQTRNLTEITRLNGESLDTDKKINALFQEVGRAYYTEHIDDGTQPYRASLDMIKELYAKRIQIQDRIKQIKGVTKCPQCGGDVPLGAQFCNNCGYNVGLRANRVCIKCGTPLAGDDAFCTVCGTKNPLIPDEKQTVNRGIKHCEKCGAVLTPGTQFCTSCGAKATEGAHHDAALTDEVNQDEYRSESRHCPACGAEIEDGSLFCTECGTRYENIAASDGGTDTGEADEIETAVQEIIDRYEKEPGDNVTELIAQVVPYRVCKKCGVYLDDDEAFCSSCGTKYESKVSDGDGSV